MDGEPPKILLRDRDDKFGTSFDRVTEGVGFRVIKTAVRVPDRNAIAERFVGSARREILDHVIVLADRHPFRLVARYKEYFNEARPHQGIGQRIPGKPPGARHDETHRDQARSRRPSPRLPVSRMLPTFLAG